MKIHINDITDRETTLDLTEDSQRPWVLPAIEKVDETVDTLAPDVVAAPTAPASKPASKMVRSYDGTLSLRKVDSVIVISGKLTTQVKLLCSRCANLFLYPVKTEFSGLFCQDPVMAGVGYWDEEGKPQGQHQGHARHAATPLGDKDLDITYLNTDTIDLSDVISEQIRLEVPFQPLCQDDCKGICPRCGADWNRGTCACSKLTKNSPFSVLKNISYPPKTG